MSNDDQVIKQYPFDLKAEATAQGYRIHGHVYGEDKEQCVKDLVSMITMAISEFEMKELPLVANAPRTAK